MYYRIFICSFSEDHWLICSIKNSASEYLSVFEILGLFSKMTGPITHQQCMSDPTSLHPCQNLVLSVFLILALRIYVKWYLFVVLIWISLIYIQLYILCIFYIDNHVTSKQWQFYFFFQLYKIITSTFFISCSNIQHCTKRVTRMDTLFFLFLRENYSLLLVRKPLAIEEIPHYSCDSQSFHHN